MGVVVLVDRDVCGVAGRRCPAMPGRTGFKNKGCRSEIYFIVLTPIRANGKKIHQLYF
jgi:hypothetical protein